jgi:multimeric flavodoxin WrbA
MEILVISSSPNIDGLTAACAQAAVAGARAAGAIAKEVRLNDLNVGLCRACGNGWGTCRDEHVCCVSDDFGPLYARLLAADATVLVTPVYWGGPSESLQAFLDRARRCLGLKGEGPGTLAGRPVMAVAAAGGSGNGAVTCLEELERWIQHVRARKTDFTPVTRFTRAYKLDQIRAAAEALGAGRLSVWG